MDSIVDLIGDTMIAGVIKYNGVFSGYCPVSSQVSHGSPTDDREGGGITDGPWVVCSTAT